MSVCSYSVCVWGGLWLCGPPGGEGGKPTSVLAVLRIASLLCATRKAHLQSDEMIHPAICSEGKSDMAVS